MKKIFFLVFLISLFTILTCYKRENKEPEFFHLFKDFSDINYDYNIKVYDSLVSIARKIDSSKLNIIKELNGSFVIANKFEGIDSVQKITEYRYIDVFNSKESIKTVNKVLFKLSKRTTLVQVNNFNNPLADTNIWKWESLVIHNDSLRCILFKSFRNGSRKFAKEKILNKKGRKISNYINEIIWRENLKQDSVSSVWTSTE